MNYKKIIGYVAAIVIVLSGTILMVVVQKTANLGPNSGALGALIGYSPFFMSIVLARFVSRRIQGAVKESKDTEKVDLSGKGDSLPDSNATDHELEKSEEKKESKKQQTDQAVYLGNFSVEIPEGNKQVDGYVDIDHNTKYSIKISNAGDRPCDAEVGVDGKQVGIWRLPSGKSVVLERPAHDTGRFTFYKFDSAEAQKAELDLDDNIGLVSVLFKPEKPPVYTDSETKYSIRDFEPGGTGLSGKSEQRFKEVRALDYDESSFVQIHLRLGCKVDEPRPLTLISTPVPPPIQ